MERGKESEGRMTLVDFIEVVGGVCGMIAAIWIVLEHVL